MTKIEIFPQDLWYFDIPVFFDLKESLIKEIYSLKNTVPSSLISNVNGWQSPSVYNIRHKSNNLRIITHRIIEHIKNDILQYSYSASIDSLWYNINPPGSSNHIHNHPGCDLAGIFYINVPSPAEKSGKLVIANSNYFEQFNYLQKSTSKYKSSEYSIEPCEGRFYLFPASLYHGVLTNETNEDRISFACNITIKDN